MNLTTDHRFGQPDRMSQQVEVANRIDTRYTPKLQFVQDEGLKHSLEVTKILDEVLPPNPIEDELDHASENLDNI